MSSTLIALLSLALLLLGGALLLWGVARQRAAGVAAVRFLDARLEQRRAASEEAAPAAAPATRSDAGAAAALRRLRQRTGWSATPRTAALLLLPALLAVAIGARLAGLQGAALGLALGAALTALAVSLRIQRQRDALIRALPGFIDSMVRLLAVGHSMPSAFLGAVGAVQGPLRQCLEGIGQRVRAGMDLDKAIEQAGRAYGAPALLLFGAVVRMSVNYGGRVDQVLERMAQFMRDREEAQLELRALSAETRLSAWVLGMLPASMAAFILFINTHYLARMWGDPTGRKLLMCAFALQLLGGFLLYRLARLR